MQMQINAKKIKQLREQRCWSQLQLAEMAGVSLRTLQRVEAKSVASQETIKGLAAVLEIDCEKLLPNAEQITPLKQHQLEQTETLVSSSSEVSENNLITRKQLIVTLVVLMASTGFGFSGVFFAYSENRIDHQQFVMFKDIVAGGFLLGLIGLAYRAYKANLISFTKFY